METRLCRCDNFVSFQVPHESVVDHAFHELANTAGKSNRTVICRVFCVSFPGFGIGTTCDWRQLEGKFPVIHMSFIILKECIESF